MLVTSPDEKCRVDNLERNGTMGKSISVMIIAFAIWLMAMIGLSYAAVIVEPGAQLSDGFEKPKFLAAVQTLVKLNGYRCDSISAAIEYVFSSADGLTLTCNHYKYSYDITDRGGRWEVKVK